MVPRRYGPSGGEFGKKVGGKHSREGQLGRGIREGPREMDHDSSIGPRSCAFALGSNRAAQGEGGQLTHPIGSSPKWLRGSDQGQGKMSDLDEAGDGSYWILGL
ncbi:unnamed protein product [Calypogeia fissa]